MTFYTGHIKYSSSFVDFWPILFHNFLLTSVVSTEGTKKSPRHDFTWLRKQNSTAVIVNSRSWRPPCRIKLKVARKVSSLLPQDVKLKDFPNTLCQPDIFKPTLACFSIACISYPGGTDIRSTSIGAVGIAVTYRRRGIAFVNIWKRNTYH